MDRHDECFQDYKNNGTAGEVTASRAELGAAKPPPPPPPYTQVQSQPYPPLAHDKPSTPSAVPFEPQQAPASSRTLHVYYDGSNWGNGRILDTDKTIPLWLFRIHTKKPHLTISTAVPPSPVLTTAVFHNFSWRIDLVIRGTPVTLSSRGAFKRGHAYQSPSLDGATLTWKSQNLFTDLVCVDEKEATLAKFHLNCWSLSKCGRLELLRSNVTCGYLTEEIVVTGMAMGEHEQQLRAKGFVDNAAGG
ncbi:MAG: hypothetical protein Q9173_002868 [Seirophora scorigena]